jgi:hypothetical protein
MIKSIIGGILVAIGGIILAGFFLNAADAAFAINAGDIVAALLLGVGPMVGGGLLIRSHMKRKQQALSAQKKDEYARREKEIIKLAQKKAGRLSIPDIVAETSLNSDEADRIMQELTTKGYVDMQVTDSGVIVYEFYEIAHRKSLDE